MDGVECDEINSQIEQVVESSIGGFFENKEVKVTHVLDFVFPKERRIRSLIGGLETSLGTKLWEPIAKTFAEKNGFNVMDEKTFNLKVPVIPESVRHLISDFENLKTNNPSVEVGVFVKKLKKHIIENNKKFLETQKMPEGEGVDVWLFKDNIHYLIDIKTTQINAGGGPKFLRNQLNWVAYVLLKDPDLNVRPILAFPFNPHEKKFWSKEKGKVSPLIPSEEALVGDEFWDFLFGKEGSTDLIMNAFKRLGEKDFGSRFSHVFDPVK